MDYDAIVALTGLVAALVAIYALWAESRRHRFSIGLEVILRLDDRFSTQRMYANRKKAASSFQKKSYTEAANEIDEIIDFFECVGFLVKRGALDKTVVWSYFFSYLFRFRHFANEYIQIERRRDSMLWMEFGTLYDQLSKIEQAARRKRTAPLELSEEDLEQFLREETSLNVS